MVWPFKKKTTQPKPSISRTKFVTNVVEYDRKSSKEKASDEENHLKSRKFLDAMKLLSKKENRD